MRLEYWFCISSRFFEHLTKVWGKSFKGFRACWGQTHSRVTLHGDHDLKSARLNNDICVLPGWGEHLPSRELKFGYHLRSYESTQNGTITTRYIKQNVQKIIARHTLPWCGKLLWYFFLNRSMHHEVTDRTWTATDRRTESSNPIVTKAKMIVYLLRTIMIWVKQISRCSMLKNYMFMTPCDLDLWPSDPLK